MKKDKAGFALVELLLVLAVIMFIVFKVFEAYLKKPLLGKEEQTLMLEQGIDTASVTSTLSSTRAKLKDIQSKHIEQLDAIK